MAKKKKSRYSSIQKILSSYTQKKGIRLGKEFNRVASRINKASAGLSLKDIRKNIGKLYNQHEKPEVIISFPSEFDFYNFELEFNEPSFDGIEINIVFTQLPEFSFSGFKLDVISLYQTSGLKNYLRTNYSESPVARFILEYTDGKTTTTYRVDVGESEVAPEIKPITDQPSIPPTDITEIDKQIELQKLIKENRELQLKLIKEYRDLGYSNEEIKKLL